MFERFSQEARHVVVLAQEEARLLGHNYIGTEHILLGLVRVEDELGAEERPLRSVGLTLDSARGQVARLVGRSEEPSPGQIPFTPRAKKVLELALREALGLGHNWIGPEHILLGIASEREGMASRILLDAGTDSEKIRGLLITYLGSAPPPEPSVGPIGALARVWMDPAWFDGLFAVFATLGAEIREQLRREPDLGDLLLVIASARWTPAGQALQQLGVDPDVLWGELEKTRLRLTEERAEATRRIRDAREGRTEAIRTQDYREAARLRDEERELASKLSPPADFEEGTLAEARRRLGLRGGE